MAQKVTVSLIDDLDQSMADETVEFGLDGVTYEIDLSSGNAGKLRDSLAGFKANARKAGSPKRPGRKAASGTAGTGPGSQYTNEQRREIREWAKANGADVAERGRMAHEIYAAWEDNRNVAGLPRRSVTASAPAVPAPAFTG